MKVFKRNQATKKVLLFIITLLAGTYIGYGQDFNNNASLTFINHNIPKSPESGSIERYGTIPVSEKTGIPDISIPLYTVKGSTLNSPVVLSYHASGIKVNQEATWVGLGWDIMAGGRITLEIKGGYDKIVNQFLGTDMRATIKLLLQVFGGGVSNNFIINETNPCNWSSQSIYDYYNNNGQIPCNYGNINVDSLFNRGQYFGQSSFGEDCVNIEKYGIGEPDLYHAEFLGKSFTFYHDLFTDSIKIADDQNLYKIEETATNGQSFVITDNMGVTYYFEKPELSYYTPAILSLNYINTAFLLTKVVSLDGDSINYTYTNYGESFSAPGISESELSVISNCNNPTVPENQTDYTNRYYSSTNTYVFQYPEYLTEISTNSTKVEFVHGSRKDISGDGNRKLEQIKIKNKFSNDVLRQIKFNYSYFDGNGGYYYIDTSLSYFKMGTQGPDNNAKNHLTLRLKLESINVYGTDSNQAQSYKFGYIENFGLPNKVSMSQDHWGYSNGAYDIPQSQFANFTPSVQALYEEGIYGGTYNSSQHPLPGHTVRKALESAAKAFTLDHITYPTGGTTQFEFELNQFYMQGPSPIKGAGLRVKRIISTSKYNDQPAAIEYDYGVGGFYQGAIQYVQNKFKDCESQDINYPTFFTNAPTSILTLFSNGVLAKSGPLVLYSSVIQKYSSGEYGRTEKYFDVISPYSTPYVEQVQLNESGYYTGHPYNISPYYLPLQPYEYSYGNPTAEKYYDKNNVLKKEKLFFYNGNISTKQYTLKLESKYFLHPSNTTAIPRAFINYFEPMVNRNTVLDSIIEINHEGSISLATKSTFKYNAFYQPEYAAITNSEGDQTISYTKTPLSYTDVPQGEGSLQGNASAISYMRFHNILDNPIERLIIKRAPNGDSTVLRGGYNIYDPIGNIRQAYLVETDSPIPISQFQRSAYSGSGGGYNISKDSRYKLKTTVNYGGKADDFGSGQFRFGPHVNEMISEDQSRSFLYDTISQNILAVCEGALHSDIAYTSFELIHPGKWSFTGSATTDPTSPTGTKCYNIGQTSGSIVCSGLDQNKEYILSYWTKNSSAFSITGTVSGSVKQGSSFQGWNYFEQQITNQTTVTISGSGYIDEVKLHPRYAQMKSFTYDNAFRIISETDIAGKIIYYSFDASNRLASIRDQDKNILKKYAYKYAEQKINFDGQYYQSNAQSQLFTKNNCSSGVPQSIVFGVPEGKYQSTVSQEDADQYAINDLAANGQTYANNNGGCQFFNQGQSVSFTQNNCASGYSGITVTYGVPPNKYVSLVNQTDANQMAITELNSISANGQTVANQGTCVELVTIYYWGSLNEPFSLELVNETTNQSYIFTIPSDDPVQVPIGTYFVRINPESYSQAYGYVINDSYYQSGETVATFEHIPFTDTTPYNLTIYIYE